MARILALSSQVASGHVGLSAMAPALQALGHEVIALPTILLSSHPGPEPFAGERVDPGLLRRMLAALEASGRLDGVDAIVTGYLPTQAHVTVAREAVEALRARNPGIVYLCDPVIGDAPKGVYIDADAAHAIRTQLVPVADAVKLNRFELSWLTGGQEGDDAEGLARRLVPPVVVVTSAEGAVAGRLANVLVTGERTWRCEVAARDGVPKGTGDLYAALLLGRRLDGDEWAAALEKATAQTDAIIMASIGRPDLAIVAALTHLRRDRGNGRAGRLSDMTSDWVAGVDGCRAGWLVVLYAPSLARARVCVVPHFSDVLALPEAPGCIAVDMPIGLPERAARGGRAADVAARAGLGGRQSSVFAVPSRAAVMLEDYREACAVALSTSDPPRKVSKQTFNLFAKIREVDRLMTPALQERVVECHPEAAFVAMNAGVALAEPKKLKSRPWEPGLELRRRLLAEGGLPPDVLATPSLLSGVAGADDLLDACACAWTAQRVLAGTARRFPDEPPRDARGLRQEIWA